MRTFLIFPVVLLALVFHPESRAQGDSLPSGATTAKYRLTVDVLWNQSNHESWAQPFSALANPHFSHLGGGTHNSDLTVWQPGGIVVPGSGMEMMQELGWIDNPNDGTSDLAMEFATHIGNGQAYSFLNWAQHFAAGTSTSLDFYATSTHPLITLTSMIAPSPDWFIGVSGLNLRDPQNVGPSTSGWQNTIVVDLFAYDGGSEDGDINFSLNGTALDPYAPISLIADTPGTSGQNRSALNSSQIGRFTFNLQSVAIPEPSSCLLFCVSALAIIGRRPRRA